MDKFDHPQEISDVLMAFPADITDLLPPMEEIPEEHKSWDNPWSKLTRKWFFSGLGKAYWSPRGDVDQETAIRHIQAILGSFAPKHEHKEAGVSYLLSRWFQGVIVKGFKSDEEGMYLFSNGGVQKLTEEEFNALVPKKE